MDTLTAEFEASLEERMGQHVVVLGRSARQPFECRIPHLGVVFPVDVGCAGGSANSIVSHELILERHPSQVKSSLGARPGWPEKPTGCMGCSPGMQITPAHGKGSPEAILAGDRQRAVSHDHAGARKAAGHLVRRHVPCIVPIGI
ncbi:MAG: hypothetical protein OXH08_07215 [Gammaproteobacteria bacterium]|nr:hypothetical protein [Gammaproteobacteria bacterium]